MDRRNRVDHCLICKNITDIKNGKYLYLVKELKTGYVVLGQYQYCKGYTLFLSKIHACELHELPVDFCQVYLGEMARVARAVFFAFRPVKLNYELLGNSEPHLHWHVFPRYRNDPNLNQPVWVVDKSVRYNSAYVPSEKTVENYRRKLLDFL